MIEFLREIATEYASVIRITAFASLGFFLITPVLAPALIVLMPADMLVRRRHPLKDRPPGRRVIYLVWHLVKNLIGSALMLLGVLLLFLPGQGLLTLFAGVLFTDLPGKRRLLAKLLGSGRISPIVDRLRTRYGKEPMIWREKKD